ncbi:MAG: hypothetical protein ACP5GZ_02590 [Vulcanisaeta sp.]
MVLPRVPVVESIIKPSISRVVMPIRTLSMISLITTLGFRGGLIR